MTDQAQQLSLFEQESIEQEKTKQEELTEKADTQSNQPAAEETTDTSRIAIVILNWNGATMLEHYLPDILKYSAGAEVIVADNGYSSLLFSPIKSS